MGVEVDLELERKQARRLLPAVFSRAVFRLDLSSFTDICVKSILQNKTKTMFAKSTKQHLKSRVASAN